MMMVGRATSETWPLTNILCSVGSVPSIFPNTCLHSNSLLSRTGDGWILDGSTARCIRVCVSVCMFVHLAIYRTNYLIVTKIIHGTHKLSYFDKYWWGSIHSMSPLHCGAFLFGPADCTVRLCIGSGTEIDPGFSSFGFKFVIMSKLSFIWWNLLLNHHYIVSARIFNVWTVMSLRPPFSCTNLKIIHVLPSKSSSLKAIRA